MIVVDSHKKKTQTILKAYPGAVIIDVTSHAQDDYVKFSPFYPHGGIPVPFTSGRTSMCVEGIWQGLKVFQTKDVDSASFQNGTMKDIKRTVRTNGPCLGHRKGISGKELLGYIEARKLIYLPSYKWVLDNKMQPQLEKLRQLSKTQTVVLLDYETNSDVLDASKPLSHASLIKAYIEGTYPVFEGSEVDSIPVKPEPKPAMTTPSQQLKVGQRVLSPKFGEGTVKEVQAATERVVVDFDKEGQKTLALKFARLELIG